MPAELWLVVLVVTLFGIVPLILEGIGLTYLVRAILNWKEDKCDKLIKMGFMFMLVAVFLLKFDDLLVLFSVPIDVWNYNSIAVEALG